VVIFFDREFAVVLPVRTFDGKRGMQFSEPAGDTLFFVVLPSILFLFSLGTLIW